MDNPAPAPGPEFSLVVALRQAKPSAPPAALWRFLDSLQRQSFSSWECILVCERGPKDVAPPKSFSRSRLIAEAYGAIDPRFKLVQLYSPAPSATTALNAGAVASSGRWITFLSGSPFSTRQKLEGWYEDLLSAQGRPEIAGLCTARTPSSSTAPGSHMSAARVARLASSPPATYAPDSAVITYLVGASLEEADIMAQATSMVVRRRLFAEFGGLDELEPAAESAFAQSLLYLQILRHGYVFTSAHEPTVPPTKEAPSPTRLQAQQTTELLKSPTKPGSGSRGGSDASSRQSTLREAIEGYIRRPLSIEEEHPRAPCVYREPLQTYDAAHDNSGVSMASSRSIPLSVFDRAPEPSRPVVALVAHKDYHAWTLIKAAHLLANRGLSFFFVDLSAAHLEEGARARLLDSGYPLVGFNRFMLSGCPADVLLLLNDWTPSSKLLLASARARGTTTIGLIEGVQDFTDADTKFNRRPYQHTDWVFLSGDFDRRFFEPKKPVRIVGVPRIDELRTETPSFPAEPVVVANVNFSYGVLEEKRALWLNTVRRAAELAGLKLVLSRHPADRGDIRGYDVTTSSMYDAIRQGSVFVSRFGSGIIEALAMGKPAIYHNPHGEQVIKFQEPLGAYAITTDVPSLALALREAAADHTNRRTRAKAFLDLHTAFSAGRSSSELLASAIEDIAIAHRRGGRS